MRPTRRGHLPRRSTSPDRRIRGRAPSVRGRIGDRRRCARRSCRGWRARRRRSRRRGPAGPRAPPSSRGAHRRPSTLSRPRRGAALRRARPAPRRRGASPTRPPRVSCHGAVAGGSLSGADVHDCLSEGVREESPELSHPGIRDVRRARRCSAPIHLPDADVSPQNGGDSSLTWPVGVTTCVVPSSRVRNARRVRCRAR